LKQSLTNSATELHGATTNADLKKAALAVA